MTTTNAAATKTRNAPRHRVVRNADDTVTLTCLRDSWLGEAGRERTFWAPSGDSGGYVREISEGRPGTLGHQVCRRLVSTGSTLESTRAGLLTLIRDEARACLRDEAAEDGRGC